MIPLAPYKSIILDDEDGAIEFCKTVRVNPNYVSEVVEIGKLYIKCPEKLYDEVITFLTGRRIILVEKYNCIESKNYKRFNVIQDEQSFPGYFYVQIKININKLVMSNGNSYYVLAE